MYYLESIIRLTNSLRPGVETELEATLNYHSKLIGSTQIPVIFIFEIYC